MENFIDVILTRMVSLELNFVCSKILLTLRFGSLGGISQPGHLHYPQNIHCSEFHGHHAHWVVKSKF